MSAPSLQSPTYEDCQPVWEFRRDVANAGCIGYQRIMCGKVKKMLFCCRGYHIYCQGTYKNPNQTEPRKEGLVRCSLAFRGFPQAVAELAKFLNSPFE